MIETIRLRWRNKLVEVTAIDGNSVLDLGIYSKHELKLLAEHFRDLAEELDPQEES